MGYPKDFDPIGQPDEQENFESAKEEAKEDIMIITPDHLISMLEAEKFQYALKIAATATQQTGHETRFSVNLLRDDELNIVDVIKGSTTNVYSLDAELLKEIDSVSLKKHSYFFLFHFHPEESGIIAPSGADLTNQGSNSARKKDVYIRYPYSGIGQVSHRGDVSLLLIQSPPNSILQNEYEEFQEESFSARSQNDISESLLGLGYRNTVVTLKKQDKGYTLSPQNKVAIRSTFTPMKVQMH